MYVCRTQNICNRKRFQFCFTHKNQRKTLEKRVAVVVVLYLFYT